MRRWFKIIFKIFTPIRIAIILGVGIFIWSLIFGDQGIIQLNKLIFLKKQLILQKDEINQDMKRMTKEKELLHDPDYLEWVVRRELGFIKPGEVIYQERDRTESR